MQKGKRGAIELSISTIVIIVLAMSMLILGLVLVKSIFSGAKYNVDQMNDKVKDQISKLFAEDTRAVVYLPNNLLTIKQGENWGLAFAIQNKIASQEFNWTVRTTDLRTEEKCGVSQEEAMAWITTGDAGRAQIASGQQYTDIIRFNIPEGSVSDVASCILRFQIVITDKDAKPYQTVSFDVDVN